MWALSLLKLRKIVLLELLCQQQNDDSTDTNEIHRSGLKRIYVVVEIYSFEINLGLESTISCVHTDYSPFD